MPQIIQPSSNRRHSIDLMEFIGILSVLIYHTTTFSYNWIEDGRLSSYFRYFLTALLSPCVPIFFFANGYLLLSRPFRMKRHLLRIAKIVLLTTFWNILTIALLMPIKGEHLSLEQFLNYLWTMPQGWTNYLWYMGALVCIYIFFPLLKITYDADKKAFLCFTVMCGVLTIGNTFLGDSASLLLNFLKLYDGRMRPNFFNMFNPFGSIYGYAFVFFCAGGLACHLEEKITAIPAKRRIRIASMVLMLSCFGLFLTGILFSHILDYVWDVVWYGFDTIFTFVSVLALFILCLSYQGKCKWIEAVSSNTLGIYFIHVLLIHLTRQYIIRIPEFTTFTGCLVYAFLILVGSFSLARLLSRFPLLRQLVSL